MSWLGLDIGGANVKIADGVGYAHSESFELWKHPEKLASKLSEMLSVAPAADSLAMTMTGELADCFATKAEGVQAIIDATNEAAEGRQLLVYLCDGQFVSTEVARREPSLASASNWHVLASFASRNCESGPALLIDLGSTTCDIIPIIDSIPTTVGQTDPERLASGELIYTGVVRSPVCAVVDEIPWRGKTCRVAQEFFSTMQDVYLLKGLLPPDPLNCSTADGRKSTIEAARARLARSICADQTMFSVEDAQVAANAISRAQVNYLEAALRQVLLEFESPPTTIVMSGQGEFVIPWLLERLRYTNEALSIAEILGPDVSICACAHALAVLARERD